MHFATISVRAERASGRTSAIFQSAPTFTKNLYDVASPQRNSSSRLQLRASPSVSWAAWHQAAVRTAST